MSKRIIKLLNNEYIIIYIFLDFTYPLRCLRVPLRARVPQVEYHCSVHLL
jgi:hypothetical protein